MARREKAYGPSLVHSLRSSFDLPGGTATEEGSIRRDRYCLRGGSGLAVAILVTSIVLELFSATFSLLLVLIQGDIPFIEFVSSGYPRLILFGLCSYLTYPPRWWTQWIKVDINFIAWLTASIAYAFLVLNQPGGLTHSAWRIHAVVLYPFVYGALTGNLRVLCKWYPWTRKKIFIYKLVRVYHALVFTIAQSVGQQWQLGGGFQIGYFGTVLLLLRELFNLVFRREATLKEELRKKRSLDLQEANDQLYDHKAPLLTSTRHVEEIVSPVVEHREGDM